MSAAQQHESQGVAYLRRPEQPQEEAPQTARSRGRSPISHLRAMFDRIIDTFATDADGVFYVDHDKHNIRSTFSGDFELEGTIKTRAGALFKGKLNSAGSLIKSEGTVVIDVDAEIAIDIECEMLIVLGKHTGKAKVRGTLVNVGVIKGEYEYGALESLGTIEGTIVQIGE
ncbi:TPA: polymer-forming cytoskeletal protein [Burkholderia cepacia]|jgi:hypothetical protein|uniref:Polymer-forming cytoskeletal protein n=3 Tax=Burkholderia cepacia complex TaxID=87882 RepID=A0A250LL84_9BURK|nr:MULTISPECIES: polymer-forming cytoskeletal protein [Burkholderia]HDV6369968.1 polymer-forming cytoskeletal protein [Burkholderia cepacia]MBR8290456.1 polymer-forming cytoskeletal protein [Burkholderia cenocepacia]MBX3826609.1 polymer-forming cytoskeletal protein [Burkholderia contaminans]MBX3845624.1 polymer-forming cytoskeletal protein [Burkholderia contaminans]MBX3863905.1 polymer-forming cytoskeletal protein [Burkholderia contaminans]